MRNKNFFAQIRFFNLRPGKQQIPFLIPIIFFSFTVNAQINQISNQEIKDSLPSLIKKAENVLSLAYMAQKLLYVTDTIPGWEGFPVKLEYQTGNDLCKELFEINCFSKDFTCFYKSCIERLT